SADFKKPGKKDLFILVSMECGLFTGNASDAFADAAVVVRVSVDGHGTRPGVVSFCGKSNGSEAPFALLANCTSSSLNSCGLDAVILSEGGFPCAFISTGNPSRRILVFGGSAGL